MQRDEARLRDIQRLSREVASLLASVDEASFVTTDAIRSSVLLKLIFVGEATRYISDELKDKYPEVRWRRIVGFRNVAVHRYWEVDWEIVWSTANFDLPVFSEQVIEILGAEFSYAPSESTSN